MVELVILPFVVVTAWLIIRAAPWVLGILAGLLVIGLMVGGRKKDDAER